MKKSDIVNKILHQNKILQAKDSAQAFAPTNIALCKYWGKRDKELNLPITSSLSIALAEKGATTTLSLHDAKEDLIFLNGNQLEQNSNFVIRLSEYLNLFRSIHPFALRIDIKMNIPVAAGLASSACGFASMASALNELFSWNLAKRDLSILARLGSGSAARSLWTGFVEWHAGSEVDGMDSFAEPLDYVWNDLRLGILSISTAEKPVSSRMAMQGTVETSLLYQSWPQKVAIDLQLIKDAIKENNFPLLGKTAESNALAMHATMLASSPPVCYFLPETIAAMHKVWELHRQGMEVYFTEDAGPNLKLLFLEKDENSIKEQFPQLEIIRPEFVSRP